MTAVVRTVCTASTSNFRSVYAEGVSETFVALLLRGKKYVIVNLMNIIYTYYVYDTVGTLCYVFYTRPYIAPSRLCRSVFSNLRVFVPMYVL